MEARSPFSVKMIRSGDSTYCFKNLKPMEFAEMKSTLQNRPTGKVIGGLSPEGQKAMNQTTEETKTTKSPKKVKRGSKGNVLFQEVRTNQEVGVSGYRRASCSDIFEDAQLETNYTSHIRELMDGEVEDLSGSMTPRRQLDRRHSYISRWVERRESLPANISGSVDEVEEVVSANRVDDDSGQEK